MRSPSELRQLCDFASVAFWLLVKIVVGSWSGPLCSRQWGLLLGWSPWRQMDSQPPGPITPPCRFGALTWPHALLFRTYILHKVW